MPIDQNQTTKFWLPAAEILLGAADLAVLTLVGHWLNLNLRHSQSRLFDPHRSAVPKGSLIPAIVFAEPHFSMQIEAPEDVQEIGFSFNE